jgi:hypothetical protein
MKEMVLSHHAASSQSLAQLLESAKGTGFDPAQEIIFKVDTDRGGYVMQQAEAEDEEAPPAEPSDTEPFIPAPVPLVDPAAHPVPTAQEARDDAADDDPKDPDDDHDDHDDKEPE